jgi:hypothetical protein
MHLVARVDWEAAAESAELGGRAAGFRLATLVGRQTGATHTEL